MDIKDTSISYKTCSLSHSFINIICDQRPWVLEHFDLKLVPKVNILVGQVVLHTDLLLAIVGDRLIAQTSRTTPSRKTRSVLDPIGFELMAFFQLRP